MPDLPELPLELLDPPSIEKDVLPPLPPESELLSVLELLLDELFAVLSEPVLEDDDCDDESELLEPVLLEELPVSLELLLEPESLEELLPVSLEPVLDEPESPELALLEGPAELSPSAGCEDCPPEEGACCPPWVSCVLVWFPAGDCSAGGAWLCTDVWFWTGCPVDVWFCTCCCSIDVSFDALGCSTGETIVVGGCCAGCIATGA